MIQTMRKGYKQTEVGVIPEDWEVKMIGGVCKLINGRGFKPFEWQEDGIPIIRIQNLNGSDDYNYYQGQYDKKLEVENGQLLFAWSGSRGTSFGPHIWFGSKGLLNYHTWKIIIDENTIVKNFFTHSLKKLTKYIEDKAHGASALVHVQKWEMEKFKFPIPKSTKEQTAIATALSDADALISSLEKLIAKKRNIKQGAMQQLLTGKTRLPGFERKKGYKQTEMGFIPSDWNVKEFVEVMDGFSSGQTPYRAIPEYYKGNIPWITSGELNYNVITDTIEKITIEGVREANLKMIPKGTFLFAITGLEAAGTRGSCAITGIEATTNQSCMALYPKEGLLITSYLYYFYLRYGNELAFKYCQGTKQQSFTGGIVKKLPIIVPSTVEEQASIASILSEMDLEIDALESKLEKYRQLKSGMMQNLLTGKIRLV